MAKKVSVTWVDDIDGSTPADETLTFAFDGVSYEIDLSAENAEEFRSAMARWIENGRKVSGTRRAARRASSTSSQSSRKAGEIREWARANGYEVSDRGRISAEIRAAYEAAN